MSLPVEYSHQVTFLQSLEVKLSTLTCSEFESAADTAYETQIFPAIFERLLQRKDISVIKNLYRILYNRVRSENMQHASTIISWLQPPQALLETALLGLEDVIEARYTAMIASITTSQLSLQGLQAASISKSWPQQQAFVVPIACDVDDFCEFFWRLWNNNTSGIAALEKPNISL